MNIVIGVASLALLALVSTSAGATDPIHFGHRTVVIAGSMATFLVASSVLALMGKPYGRQLMLVGAMAFYGTILLQNAYIFTHASGSAVLGQKILANVVRSGIEIAINVWALLSSRTRQFFQSGSV